MSHNKLSKERSAELLQILQTRFEKNILRPVALNIFTFSFQTSKNMQETVIIPFKGKKDTILDVFSNLSSRIDLIEDLLIKYHFNKREKVLNVVVEEGTFFINDDGMGKFTVNYIIGLFNACADIDYAEKARMNIVFKTNLNDHQIIITGEYIPEREPDEL